MDTRDSKKKTIINNNGYIPPEIIEEILGKVSSVKDLLVFRSVCKSWKTLIDSDNFKKNHFQLSAKSSRLLIWRKIGILPPTTLQMFNLGQFLDFSQLPPLNNNNNNNNLGPFLKLSSETIMITLPDDIQERHRLYKKFGVVNGLVCLSLNFDFHVVWNPSTKQYKIFNAPLVKNILFQFFFYSQYFILNHRVLAAEVCAFGFDPVSQDYKFLMAAAFKIKNNKMFVYYWLYSLRNSSWKQDVIEEFPLTNNLVHGDGYMDDGKFYWFAKHCSATSGPALILFDFCTEAFDWMPLPQELANVNEAVAVANCRGLELLTTFVVNGDDELKCEVWRMQNNSNDGSSSSSWSRKYTIDLGGTGVVRWRPVGLLKGGEMMFQGPIVVDPFNTAVILIHPHTLSCTCLGVAEDIRAFNFVNSLFSVNL